MSKGTIRLRNDRALQAEFGKLEGKLQKKLARRSLRKGAKVVQDRAKLLAPEGEGELAKGIRVRSIRRTRTRVGSRVTIDISEVGHASFQEWGTRYIEAQHFMFQAAIEKAAEVGQVVKSDLRKAVHEVASESKAKRI